MQEVIDFYYNLKSSVEAYEIDLKKNNPSYENAFGMIQQNVVMALELLSFYINTWKTIDATGMTPEQIENSRQQNWERVILIGKMSFILSVSEIEYCARTMTDRIPNLKLQNIKKTLASKKWIYLRDIMIESEKNRIIDQSSLDNWKNIIELRNHIIHNNAVAEEDKTVMIDGIKIQYQKGKQIQGNLLFFPKLTENLSDWYKTWLDAL